MSSALRTSSSISRAVAAPLASTSSSVANAAVRGRGYATISSTRPHHKVVIVGGGTAGVTVAAQLRKSLEAQKYLDKAGDIAIVEPAQQHHYQREFQYRRREPRYPCLEKLTSVPISAPSRMDLGRDRPRTARADEQAHGLPDSFWRPAPRSVCRLL